MQPERWARIKDIFNAVLECSVETREAFLAQACANDPELRKEVESLLAAHESSEGFIDQPALHATLRSRLEDS